jgi:magnesium-transporting ATPase (P-type)
VPYVTFNDYVLYSNLLGCLTTLFYSFLAFRYAVDKTDMASPDPQNVVWSHETRHYTSLIFMFVTAVFLFLPYIIFAVFTLLHYCKWQPQYTKAREAVKRAGTDAGDKVWALPGKCHNGDESSIQILG